MRKLSTFTTAAILAFGVAGTALAQAPAPAGAATDPHHPGAPAGAPQAVPPPVQQGAPGPGAASPGAGMMGGDMGRMMQQMMQSRMAAARGSP
jgi:hypothetical protein